MFQVPCNFDAVVYDNLTRVADADVLSTTVADAARSLSALDAREALLRNSLEQLEDLVEVWNGLGGSTIMQPLSFFTAFLAAFYCCECIPT